MIEKEIKSLKTLLNKHCNQDKDTIENNFQKMFVKLPKHVQHEALKYCLDTSLQDSITRKRIMESGILEGLLKELINVDVDNICSLQTLLNYLTADVIRHVLTPTLNKRLIALKESTVNRIEYLMLL